VATGALGRHELQKKSLFAEEQARPAVARRRAQWKKYQGRLDPRRLVFIDETWAKTNMTPIRGWAPRGKPLIAHAPFGKWRTLTFLAARRYPLTQIVRIRSRHPCRPPNQPAG
jgi:hypothetical protein